MMHRGDAACTPTRTVMMSADVPEAVLVVHIIAHHRTSSHIIAHHRPAPPGSRRPPWTWTWSCASRAPLSCGPRLPSCLAPPAALSQQVSSLHLCDLDLNTTRLAEDWQLHDTALWPHLRHLTIDDCGACDPVEQRLQPIPRLRSFVWLWNSRSDAAGTLAALLPLAAHAQHLEFDREESEPQLVATALAALPHLTSVEILPRYGPGVDDAVAAALLEHPALQHVTLDGFWLEADHSARPCRWKTLTWLENAYLLPRALGLLPLAGLERLTIRCEMGWDHDRASNALGHLNGLSLLEQLHRQGRLVVVPWLEGGQRAYVGGPAYVGGVESVRGRWAAVWGVLPTCVRRVQLILSHCQTEGVQALVGGAVQALQHRVTLSLLVSKERLKGVLRAIPHRFGAEAGGVHCGAPGGEGCLTVEVVQWAWDYQTG